MRPWSWRSAATPSRPPASATSPTRRSARAGVADGRRRDARRRAAACWWCTATAPRSARWRWPRRPSSREVPPQPLFVLGRDDPGPARLPAGPGDRRRPGHRAGRPRTVAAVMTQVVVRRRRPRLRAAHQADRPVLLRGPRPPARRRPRAGTVAEDSGRGWRRVVASPGAGRGGGGRRRSGACSTRARWWWPAAAAASRSRGSATELVGVDAVIDKDFAAALIGRLVGATSLLLLTGVERVLARLRHAAASARSTR